MKLNGLPVKSDMVPIGMTALKHKKTLGVEKSESIVQERTVGSLRFKVEAPSVKQGDFPHAAASVINLKSALLHTENSPKAANRRRSRNFHRTVHLEPGFSQVAWMEKAKHHKKRVRQRVKYSELQKHCHKESLWISYKRVVYDCTPYIPCVTLFTQKY